MGCADVSGKDKHREKAEPSQHNEAYHYGHRHICFVEKLIHDASLRDNIGSGFILNYFVLSLN